MANRGGNNHIDVINTNISTNYDTMINDTDCSDNQASLTGVESQKPELEKEQLKQVRVLPGMP